MKIKKYIERINSQSWIYKLAYLLTIISFFVSIKICIILCGVCIVLSVVDRLFIKNKLFVSEVAKSINLSNINTKLNDPNFSIDVNGQISNLKNERVGKQ
jgi:hypothetical protein